jgi:ferredoxin-NADP reductase
MKRPQLVESIVTDKNWVSSKVIKLTLEHIKPLELDFTAGQFISLYVGEDKYRAYSICSSPHNSRKIDLIISAKHMGIGSSFVRLLKQGDTVKFIGPSGKFCLTDLLPENLFFFATGVGISPFISMLHTIQKNYPKAKTKLFQGVRFADEVLYRGTLEDFKENLANFDYEIFLSKEEHPLEKYLKGRITKVLEYDLPIQNAHYYICGNPYMVADIKKGLLDRGIPESAIFYEGFTYAVS